MSRLPSRAEQLAGYRRVLEARAATTSLQRFRELVNDPIIAVRIGLARNPHTPPAILRLLADDQHHTVVWNALLHPQMPASGLRRLARLEARIHGRRNLSNREAIAHHPNASRLLRIRLIHLGTCRDKHTCTIMRGALTRAANLG